MITNLLLTLLLIGLGFLIAKTNKRSTPEPKILEENAHLKAEIEQKSSNIGELSNQLKTEKSEKDQLAGKNKQIFIESTRLQTEIKTLNNELNNFRSSEKSREKEISDKFQQLNSARVGFDEEKQRVRREDEEKIRKVEEARDRMWTDHEKNVKNQLLELCKNPEYSFSYYDNTNLPISFPGRFKPDSLIQFLDQYVIFDAKISKADNLQNYINTNVKTTAEKIDNDPRIYPMVFFVVPTEAIKVLKQIRFYEKNLNFFVISPETIEIILATLKRISGYELAEKFDPQDRESILNIIAEFDNHINMRNALDIIGAQHGVSILQKAKILPQDIKEGVQLKKNSIRFQQASPTEIKSLMINAEVQDQMITDLISPKSAVSENNLKEAKAISKRNRKSQE